MALFKPLKSTSAYLKAGALGFAGGGKTFTATEIAIGLTKFMGERGLKEGGLPIYFMDTETGADFIEPTVRRAGIEICGTKTRAFKDLVDGTREAEGRCSVLIIDSVTHFWREFTETYSRRKNRSRLEFGDWTYLKQEWGRFTDLFINANCHIILCGRAGYEYDFEENEDGKKDLVKTGVKMKAETEMGYEPSLLFLMERHENVKTHQVQRVAHILKCRYNVLDGQALTDPQSRGPKFEQFLPHIQLLNLGGQQLGVDTSRTSDDLILDDGTTRWQYEKQQKKIALDEVAEEIAKQYPGQGGADKKAKADMLEEAFGTRSWAKVESLKLEQLKVGRDRVWQMSRGHNYGAEPGPADDNGGWVAGDQPAAGQQQPSGLELADVAKAEPANAAAAEAAGK